MNQPLGLKKRPTIITIICVLCFLGAFVAIPMVVSPAAAQVGSWYPPYLAFSAIVGFICMVKLWKMKKLGAYGYATFVAINQIFLLIMGIWNISALIAPAVVAGIALAYVKKMD